MKSEEVQPAFLRMRTVFHALADHNYFKSEDEWKSISELVEKSEFKFLMSQLPCIVSIYNLQTGWYEFISENMFTELGHNPELFKGEKGLNLIQELLMPEQASVFVDEVMKNIFSYIFQHATPSTGKDYRFTICAKLQSRDKVSKWYLMDTNILQVNENGHPLRTIFTMTDVNKLKKDDHIYYDILKRDNTGIYRPVLQKVVKGTGIPTELSEREYEILRLMCNGFTSPQIAASLFISLYTVQTHRRNIKRKLKCRTTSEMINFAMSRGII